MARGLWLRTHGWPILLRSARAFLASGAIISVGLLLFWLAGTFARKISKTTLSEPAGAVQGAWRVVEVRRVRWPSYETAIGTIKPVHEVAVASKLLARVLELRVKAGQAVTSGELLVKLDDAQLVSRLRQAEAAQQSAFANRERAIADLERAEKLVKGNTISRAEYDAAVATARSARAEFERLSRAFDEAGIWMSYTELRSPLDGIVIDKRVEAGDTVSPGQVLLTLYDPTNMQMVATVRESLAQRLKVGQTIPARLESLGYECEATISEIVPEANVASRSFQVKVVGPCPAGVYSGMFGRLLIPLDDEELLVIPSMAVQRVGQLEMVNVKRAEQISRRMIRIGRERGDEIEVLSGLRDGELVVVGASESTKEDG